MLRHLPAKFAAHRSYKTENNDACDTSSNSNTEVPMLGFQCRGLQITVLQLVGY